MVDSRYPNRWFGANPQAISPQGKAQQMWDRRTPKDWRSALGVPPTPPKDPNAPEHPPGYWDAEPPKRGKAILVVIVVLAVIAVGVGWLIGNSSSSSSSGPNLSATVNPTIAAGGHDFVNFACAACHGMQGKGGPDPVVPVLTTVGTALSTSQITNIITYGLGQQPVPAGQGTLNPVTGSAAPYMPTWKNILSKTQIADLVSYIQAGLPAVPGAVLPTVPTGQGDVVAGQVLFTKFGCENCHGGNGLGGAVNPNNPGGPLPFLGGPAFDQQFPTSADVISVIKSGSIIGKAPITSMPHWGGIIPQAQLEQLVTYIRTLPGAPS
jgi:mono/diheme cytochrome c family protein